MFKSVHQVSYVLFLKSVLSHIMADAKITLDIRWKTKIRYKSSCLQMFFKTSAQVFSCEICKILKNTFFKKHLLAAENVVKISNKLWVTPKIYLQGLT